MSEPTGTAPQGVAAPPDESAAGNAPAAESHSGAPGSELAPASEPLAPVIEPKRGPGRPRGSGKSRRRGKSKRTARTKAADVQLDRAAREAAARRDAEAAAAREASAIASGAGDPPASAPAPAASDAPGGDDPQVQGVSDAQLAKMIGLTAHLVAKTIPPKYGGGALTEEERDMLGAAWAAVAKPYLQGEGSAITLALAATVQVFALRAITYQPPAIEAVTHSRAAAAGSPPSDGAKSAASAPSGKAVTSLSSPKGAQYDKDDVLAP